MEHVFTSFTVGRCGAAYGTDAQGVPAGRHQQCVEALVALYEAWEKAEPLRAPRDLRQRFLACHVQPRQGPCHQRQRLQQQGRLADPGIATDQHHRPFRQAAAEHAVELADASGHARLRVGAHVGQRGHLRCIHLARPTAAPGRRRCRLRGCFQHHFGERIPRAAGIALALPLGVVRAALAADMDGAALLRGQVGGGLGHDDRCAGDAAL